MLLYDYQSVMVTVPRKRPSRLHDAIDWSASLEKSQDCETGGSCSEMLERMSAQNRANRINFLVKVFQQLGQRIEGCSGDPIGCSSIFRREEPEDQDQCKKRKKLRPGIEPQIVGPTPQQKTKNANCQQRSQQHRSRSRIHALLDDGGKDCGEAQRHGQPIPKQGAVIRIQVVI